MTVNGSAHDACQQAYKLAQSLPRKLFIDGKWVDAASGATEDTLDPRTGEVICSVAKAGAEDVDRAVAAARKAFDTGDWPRMTGSQRGKVLLKIAEAIEANADSLAALETLDQGKTLVQSRQAHIPQSAEHFRYFAGWCDKIEGETIPSATPHTIYTLREPIGVVGQILPWNFPLLMAAWKVAPALAAGCSIVLKVSQYTPLTAIRLVEICHEAGVPPGTLNLLTGKGSEIGDAITNHPHIDKVAFTGSTSVGEKIMEGCSGGIKPVTLELGGNSPVVVAPDADMESAVAGAHEALFFNTGEACECGARIYVHESIYDEFVQKSVQLAKQRKAGDPFDTDVRHGPLVSEKQMNKVMSYIKKGQEEGATLAYGGNRIGDKGFLIEPTVFCDVEDHMAISRDEIFGPVQVILKYKTFEEVIKRANDTEYGLAAAVWTKDIETMQALTRGIKAGTVWVNCHHIMDASAPFGGYKQSGIGREHGKAVLEHYTETKSVVVPLPKMKSWQIM